MQYLEKSFSPQQQMNKLGSPWTAEQTIEYILTETKYFIAVDTKSLLSESKTAFIKHKKNFMIVEVETIELLKKYSKDIIHFVLNKGSVPVKITISLTSFVKSGLYMDNRIVDDIKTIIDDYDKRRRTYKHNLQQTNIKLKKLKQSSQAIIELYPEKFI